MKTIILGKIIIVILLVLIYKIFKNRNKKCKFCETKLENPTLKE